MCRTGGTPGPGLRTCGLGVDDTTWDSTSSPTKQQEPLMNPMEQLAIACQVIHVTLSYKTHESHQQLTAQRKRASRNVHSPDSSNQVVNTFCTVGVRHLTYETRNRRMFPTIFFSQVRILRYSQVHCCMVTFTFMQLAVLVL